MKQRPKNEAVRSKLPAGWTRKQIDELARHYENQTDDEAIAEADAAYESTPMTMMAIPVELVPAVQKMISKRAE